MIPVVISWTVALFTLGCGAISWRNLRKQTRTMKNLRLLWTDEAPPVPPVEVLLKTGETVTVQPTNVHKAWVWQVPIPAHPDAVEEVVIPELPPYTSLIPMPPSLFKEYP